MNKMKKLKKAKNFILNQSKRVFSLVMSFAMMITSFIPMLSLTTQTVSAASSSTAAMLQTAKSLVTKETKKWYNQWVWGTNSPRYGCVGFAAIALEKHGWSEAISPDTGGQGYPFRWQAWIENEISNGSLNGKWERITSIPEDKASLNGALAIVVPSNPDTVSRMGHIGFYEYDKANGDGIYGANNDTDGTKWTSFSANNYKFADGRTRGVGVGGAVYLYRPIQSTSLKITKVDENGNKPTSGEFKFSYGNNKTITLNAENSYEDTISDLTIGDEITVTETSASDGYELVTKNDANKKTITLVADSSKNVLKFSNNRQGKIKVLKVTQGNSASNSENKLDAEVPVSGVTYKIYPNANCNENEAVATLTTDANGEATSENLNFGDYWIKEISVPSPIVIDKTPKKVTINSVDKVSAESTAKFTNDTQDGQITITKTGEVVTGYDSNTQNFIWEKRGLKDTTFDLVADEDIYIKVNGNNKKLKYTKDQVIETKSTGVDGSATFKKVPLGNYKIVEKTVPSSGYILNSTPIKVSLTYENSEKSFVSHNATQENKRHKLNVNFTKKDHSTGQAVPQATYSLYANEPIKDYKGNVIANKGTLLKTQTFATGSGKFEIDLPFKNDANNTTYSFYIKETQGQVPWGYVYSSSTHNFVFTPLVTSPEIMTENVEMENQIIKGKLVVNKKDADRTPTSGDGVLSGAEYVLVAEENIYHPDGKTTNYPGTPGLLYKAGDTVVGNYKNGAYKNENYQTKNGNYVAKFKGQDKEGNQINWTKNLVTNEKATFTIDNLWLGKYRLVEVKSSVGYTLSEDQVFDIKQSLNPKDENTTVVSVTKTSNERPMYGKLNITKITSNTTGVTIPLENVGFKVKLKSEFDAIKAKYIKNGLTEPEAYDKALNESHDYGYNGLVTNGKQTVYTDANGKINVTKLPYGEYILIETNPLPNYNKMDDFTFVINKDYSEAEYQYVVVNDYPSSVWLQIQKKDATTNNLVARAGATFEIYANEDIRDADNTIIYHKDQKIEMWKGNHNNPSNKVSQFVTDENGKTELPEKLYPGNYYLKETKAPAGYKLNTTKMVFKVGKAQATVGSDPDNLSMTITMKDTPIYGNVELTKKSEIFMGYDKDSKYVLTEGAEFDLVANQTIYSMDGTGIVKFYAGDVVAHGVTGADGKLKFTNIPLNYADSTKFILRETKTGVNNVGLMPDKIISFDTNRFDGITNDITLTVPEKDIRNEITPPEYGKIIIEKIDSVTKKPIKDVKFALYTKNPIKNQLGETVVNANVKLDEKLTTEYGEVEFSGLMPGDYYVVELQQAYGYVTNREKIDFTVEKRTEEFVDEDGDGINDNVYETLEYTTTVENDMTEYEFAKIDSVTNVKIDNAFLQIVPVAADGKTLLWGETVDSWYTEYNKNHVVRGALDVGKTYALVETIPPTNLIPREDADKELLNGYLKADPIYFTVPDTKDTQYITMKNDFVKGSMYIYKHGDILTSATAPEASDVLTGYFTYVFGYEDGRVQGAKFEIRANKDIVNADKISGKYFNEGDLVATVTTNNLGIARLSNPDTVLSDKTKKLPSYFKDDELPLGSYRINEVKAGDGYILNPETKVVELGLVDWFTPVVFKTTDYKNVRQKIDVTVNKKDVDNGTPLKGAEFTLYNKNEIKVYNVEDFKDSALVTDGEQVKPNGTLVTEKQIIPANTAIARVTTDENGVAHFEADLPLGEYYIKETKAPIGYHRNAEVINIDARYQGQEVDTIVLEKTFTDKITTVEFSKTDKQSHVEINGATLAVYPVDENGNAIKGECVDTWVSNHEERHIVYGLEAGRTYVLQEIGTPENYLKADDIVFTVTDTEDNIGILQKVHMEDVYVKGQFYVYKNGEHLTSVIAPTPAELLTGYFSYVFNYELGPVEGAKFEVYANRDIKHPDGYSQNFFEKDELIGTITTNKLGIALFTNRIEKLPENFGVNELPLGDYRIKEVVASDGFVLNTEEKIVTLDYIDEFTPVVYNSISYTNDRQKVDITIEKEDVDNGTKLSGAEFTLYNKTPIQIKNIVKQPNSRSASTDKPFDFSDLNIVVNGDVIPANTAIARVTTDKNGVAHFEADLPLGEYYIKETKAPIGYHRNAEVINIDATYKGQNVDVIKVNKTFTDKITTIEFSKTDNQSNVEIDGATLAVIPVDENGNVMAGETHETWVSNHNEKHIVYGLEAGKTYVLREIGTPVNYLKADDVKFTVTDTEDNIGTLQKVHMSDVSVKGQFFVFKDGEHLTSVKLPSANDLLTGYFTTIFGYTKGPVEGAKFEIYANQDIKHPDGYSDDYFKKDELIGTITTNKFGIAMFDGRIEKLPANFGDNELPLGEYRIKEIVAGDGFVLNTEEKIVVLDYIDEFTPVVYNTSSYTNARQKIDVTLTKEDVDNGTKLSGAEFTLYNKTEIQVKNIVDNPVNTLSQSSANKPTFPNKIVVNGDIVPADTAIARVTTGTDGVAHFDLDLPLGEYYIKETKAPIGYHRNAEVVNIDATYKGQNVDKIVIDKIFTDKITTVEFSKTDITTGVELDGAFLQVFPVDEKGNAIEGAAFDSWYSNHNEKHIIKGLEAGKTYILRETMAADGYLKAEDIKFTVVDTEDNIGILQKVHMEDVAVKGSFYVYKKGEFLTTVSLPNPRDMIMGYFSVIFGYEDGPVKGAKFEVYAREDIKHPDGYSEDFFKKDELIGTITSNELGIAKFETTIEGLKEFSQFDINELPLGKYYVKEVIAGNGFVLNDEIKDVELKYNDQYTPIVFENETYTNQRQKVDVKLQKIDAETKKPVKGAVFLLSNTEDIVKYKNVNGIMVEDGVAIPANGWVEQLASDENGLVHFTADLPLGKYQIIEVKPAIGYLDNTEVIEFDTSYNIDKQEIPTLKVEKVVENTPSKAIISKLDIEKLTPLKGATLSIYPKAQGAGATFATWISGETPETIKYLETNTVYVLHEVSPALGNTTAQDIEFMVKGDGTVLQYKAVEKSDIVIPDASEEVDPEFSVTPTEDFVDSSDVEVIDPEFSVVPNENVEETTKEDEVDTEFSVVPETYEFVEVDEVVMVDDYTKVEISKKDITTFDEIEGAHLQIVDNLTKEVVESWVSGTDGFDDEGNLKPHYIERLPIGEYTLIETKAPTENGYVKSEDVVFEVTDTGIVQNFVMYDDYTKVEISKSDITGKKEIEGAHLQIIDSNNVVIESWVSGEDGLDDEGNLKPHYIEYLPVGEYTLKETKTPYGYAISEDVKFHVDETGEIQKVQMKDEELSGRLEITKYNGDKTEKLEGAEFTLTAAEDIKDLEGNIVFHKGDKVQDVKTSDKNGLVVFENLLLGSYNIAETKAPEGFTKTDEVFNIKFEYKENLIEPVIRKTVDVTNTFIDTSVTPESSNNLFVIATLTAAVGFGLYAFKSSKKKDEVTE